MHKMHANRFSRSTEIKNSRPILAFYDEDALESCSALVCWVGWEQLQPIGAPCKLSQFAGQSMAVMNSNYGVWACSHVSGKWPWFGGLRSEGLVARSLQMRPSVAFRLAHAVGVRFGCSFLRANICKIHLRQDLLTIQERCSCFLVGKWSAHCIIRALSS